MDVTVLDSSAEMLKLVPANCKTICADMRQFRNASSGFDLVECSSMQSFGNGEGQYTSLLNMCALVNHGGILQLQGQRQLFTENVRETLERNGFELLFPMNLRLQLDRDWLTHQSVAFRGKIADTCDKFSLLFAVRTGELSEALRDVVPAPQLFQTFSEQGEIRALRQGLIHISSAQSDHEKISAARAVLDSMWSLREQQKLNPSGVFYSAQKIILGLFTENDVAAVRNNRELVDMVESSAVDSIGPDDTVAIYYDLCREAVNCSSRS